LVSTFTLSYITLSCLPIPYPVDKDVDETSNYFIHVLLCGDKRGTSLFSRCRWPQRMRLLEDYPQGLTKLWQIIDSQAHLSRRFYKQHFEMFDFSSKGATVQM